MYFIGVPFLSVAWGCLSWSCAGLSYQTFQSCKHSRVKKTCFSFYDRSQQGHARCWWGLCSWWCSCCYPRSFSKSRSWNLQDGGHFWLWSQRELAQHGHRGLLAISITLCLLYLSRYWICSDSLQAELTFSAGDIIHVFGDMDEDGFYYVSRTVRFHMPWDSCLWAMLHFLLMTSMFNLSGRVEWTPRPGALQLLAGFPWGRFSSSACTRTKTRFPGIFFSSWEMLHLHPCF